MHKSEQAAIEATPVGKWTYYAWWFAQTNSALDAYGPDRLSVGIFQIVPKARKGKKRAKAIYRVAGPTSQRDHILTDAQAICDKLNELSPQIDRATAREYAHAVMAERKAQR